MLWPKTFASLLSNPTPREIVGALTLAGWRDVKAPAQISGLDRMGKEFAPDIVLICER
ncbi:hypothetical protein [uncultured Tateyamaria sp.]|uniref:hypothetical protein n=1 Tax=uncultured Tateyamaria sp. TaxID=455651 RepID=UPI00262F40D4|nr:hypothetical protein [uncultured Tateyamaria sp.]